MHKVNSANTGDITDRTFATILTLPDITNFGMRIVGVVRGDLRALAR